LKETAVRNFYRVIYIAFLGKYVENWELNNFNLVYYIAKRGLVYAPETHKDFTKIESFVNDLNLTKLHLTPADFKNAEWSKGIGPQSEHIYDVPYEWGNLSVSHPAKTNELREADAFELFANSVYRRKGDKYDSGAFFIMTLCQTKYFGENIFVSNKCALKPKE
jgi:hypothetical protein